MMKKLWIFAWMIGLLLLLIIIFVPLEQGTFLWRSVSFPLAGQTIVIDPGHGGVDGGAVANDAERTQEKEITLSVSKLLKQYLEQAGAIVYLTREEDIDLADPGITSLSARKSQDIRRRLAFIHEKETDFFLSIHLNALPSNKWSGAQTFFYPKFPENKLLATHIQDEMIRQLENTTRTPLQIDYVYLLKHAEVPGVLVEIGFLSNEIERELLKQKSYQEKIAASIYHGILNYVTDEKSEKAP